MPAKLTNPKWTRPSGPKKPKGEYQTALGRLIGRNLRRRREALGLSQWALAEKCEMERSYFSRVELGWRTPRLDTLLTIARALNCTPADLLEGDADA